jgi:acyl carrier protein
MKLDLPDLEAAIKQQLIAIADKLDADARSIEADDIIPATGVLDSAGIFELITWYDLRFELSLKEEEITIDNLGSIRKMANFVMQKKAAQ